MEHIPKEKKRAKNRRACPLPGDESQLPVHYSPLGVQVTGTLLAVEFGDL